MKSGPSTVLGRGKYNKSSPNSTAMMMEVEAYNLPLPLPFFRLEATK